MTNSLSPDQAARRDRMGILARAEAAALAALMPPAPAHRMLRAPEVGAVMVRGRAGATGAPFNLGEMSVTRCSLRLDTGEVGHSYVQGRDKEHARNAALIDALAQRPEGAEIERIVLRPLAEAEAARAQARAEKAAATRVEFFTLVRGEDQ